MRWFCHSSSSFAPKSTPPVAAADVSASPPLPPPPPSFSVASSPPLPPPPPSPPPISASVASSPPVAPPPTLSTPTPTTATAAAETSSSSQDDTPRSRSTVLSPSTSTSTATTIIDLSREYTKAVQTSSYAEIWDKLHEFPVSSASHHLDQLLHPNRYSIHQALQSARPPSHLTRLVSAYFDTSEHTSKLCLLLQRSVDNARHIYAPLHDLLEFLPPNSPAFSSHSQLDWAFSSLSDFDLHDNPFPSDANFHDMRLCFSNLKLQLDRRLRKARHRVRIARRTTRCYCICLIGTAVGAAVSAVLVATHALAAIVAVPFLTFLPSTRFANQQLEHIAQLDAAARGTYVLNNDLDTIDRLVARLHATVESDKLLVRLGLQRGKEAYPIQEVLKHIRKNQPNFLHQLKDLEEHVCLCFAAVNRARSLLLQQIHLYQTRSSDPQMHFCLDKCSSSDSLTLDN